MKKGSGLVWVAVALVVVVALAVGGYFGFTQLMKARGKAALEATVAFEESMWGHDASSVEELLPPAFASAMTSDDLEALSNHWQGWEFDEITEWTDDSVEVALVRIQVEGVTSDSTMDASYELSSDPSLSEARVDVIYSFSAAEGEEESLDESATFDLVWIDGAWRIAQFSFEGEGAFDYTFYREGKDVDRLLEDLRETIGVGAEETEGEGDDGGVSSGSTTEDAEFVVESFHAAVMSGEYDRAWALLPEEKRVATSAEDFAAQLEGYDITGYRILGSWQDGDDSVTVQSEFDAAGSTFGYTWRVERVEGEWVAVSREITGMTEEQVDGELPSDHPDLGSGN